MAGTKILKPDLGFDIQQLLTDVEASKGTATSLQGRLDNVDQSISALGTDVTTAEGEITATKAAIGFLDEEGNYNEAYEHDAFGNVTKQTVSGDKVYTVNYVYADAANGTLNYSEKTYVKDSENVVVKKTYTYDPATGNITGVSTVTTKTPIV